MVENKQKKNVKQKAIKVMEENQKSTFDTD